MLSSQLRFAVRGGGLSCVGFALRNESPHVVGQVSSSRLIHKACGDRYAHDENENEVGKCSHCVSPLALCVESERGLAPPPNQRSDSCERGFHYRVLEVTFHKATIGACCVGIVAVCRGCLGSSLMVIPFGHCVVRCPRCSTNAVGIAVVGFVIV